MLNLEDLEDHEYIDISGIKMEKTLSRADSSANQSIPRPVNAN